MPTISGLPDGPTTLTGSERLPVDQTPAGTTVDISTGAIARLAELYAAGNGAAPERIDTLGAHFTTQAAGDPKAIWFPPTINVVGGYGPVAEQAGGLQLLSRWPASVGSAKVLEVVAEITQVSVGAGESPVARVGLHSLLADYTNTAGTVETVGAATAVLGAGQTVTIRQRFAATADAARGLLAWADADTANWLRAFVQINLKSDLSSYVASSVARVRRLSVHDVTAVAYDPSGTTAVDNLSVGKQLLLTGPCLVTGVSGTLNDYNPAGLSSANVLKIGTTGPTIITGIAGGVAGRKLRVVNTGTAPITFCAALASGLAQNSASANRIHTPNVSWTLGMSCVVDMYYDGDLGRWRLEAQGRDTLYGARTYYVSPTGNDAADGLTVGSPFLTLQRAISAVGVIDFGGFVVTIQVAAGTYGGHAGAHLR